MNCALRFCLLVCIAFPVKWASGQSENAPTFPYELKRSTELVFGGLILGTNGTSLLLGQNSPDLTEEYILGLNSNDLLSIDRSATNQFSESAATISDVTLLGEGLAVSWLILNAGKKDRKKVVTLGVMYSEALLLSIGTTYIAKNSVNRPRPLLYNSNLLLEDRLAPGKENRRSFFSGHSSLAFCTAVFCSSTFSTLHPNSKRKGLVWGVSLAAAGTVGYMRYKAGKHFPTDILVGAGAGSLIGYAVERMHRKSKNNKVSWFPWLVPTQQYAGIGVHIEW